MCILVLFCQGCVIHDCHVAVVAVYKQLIDKYCTSVLYVLCSFDPYIPYGTSLNKVHVKAQSAGRLPIGYNVSGDATIYSAVNSHKELACSITVIAQ